ncbi:MAG: FAD-binding oxidoreductase [Steroidobacteraceae bacterium]
MIDCQFSRVGKPKLAANWSTRPSSCARRALMAEHVDPDTRMVCKELRSEIGSDRYWRPALREERGHARWGVFGHGLAEAAARRGARIHPHTPVIGLRRLSGQAHEVRTPQASLRARQVLLATGTSSTGPLGWIRRRIVPVGAFLIVTEPLPTELLDRLTPRRRNTTDTLNFVNYFRVTPDNRLLFGGRARFATSNAASDAKSGVILRRSMVKVFPELPMRASTTAGAGWST